MKSNQKTVSRRSRTPVAAETEAWTIRGEDNQTFGPVNLETLRTWVREGRIGPSHMISRDGKEWLPAPRIQNLAMNWLVETSAGNFYGPIHGEALAELIQEGDVSAETPQFYCRAELNADPHRQQQEWAQRMREQLRDFDARLSQTDAECQALRRERDELRASLQAKDLEFEAERQECRAAAARIEAEKLKLGAVVESLRNENRDLTQNGEKRHALELELQDAQRSLAAEREAFNAERARQRQDLETQRTNARKQADHIKSLGARLDELNRLREQEQRALREELTQHRLRARSVTKLLQQSLSVMSDDPANSPVRPPDAPPVSDPVEPPAPARPASPSSRTATLATIESRAQQELRRLQLAGGVPSFWRRGKHDAAHPVSR